MKTLIINEAKNGEKDWFYMFLNKKTGETAILKNAGCQAIARDVCCETFCVERSDYISGWDVFFLGENTDFISEKIPKKYRKFI